MVNQMNIHELPTPALLADADAFEHNLKTMAAALPGPRLRPHVKAHKCTALARMQARAGHRTLPAPRSARSKGYPFGRARRRSPACQRSARCAPPGSRKARVTVAVDSVPTILAAAQAGIKEVLIDVNVGLPRCGCAPDDAGARTWRVAKVSM